MKTRKLFLTAALMMGLTMTMSCDEQDNPVNNGSTKTDEFTTQVNCQRNEGDEWKDAEIKMLFKVTSEDPAEVKVSDCEQLTGKPVKFTIPETLHATMMNQGQEVIKNYAVTAIGVMAFYDGDALTEVVLPSGLKQIEGFAFGNCKSLESIDIPQSVETIDSYAFDGCTSLKKATIHGNPTLTASSFPAETQLEYVKE